MKGEAITSSIIQTCMTFLSKDFRLIWKDKMKKVILYVQWKTPQPTLPIHILILLTYFFIVHPSFQIYALTSFLWTHIFRHSSLRAFAFSFPGTWLSPYRACGVVGRSLTASLGWRSHSFWRSSKGSWNVRGSYCFIFLIVFLPCQHPVDRFCHVTSCCNDCHFFSSPCFYFVVYRQVV